MNDNLYNDIRIYEDGSYIVVKDGVPYHIYNGDDYIDEYNQLVKYINDNNIEVTPYCESVDIDYIPKEDIIRDQRNYLLDSIDKRVLKYKEQKELGIKTDDTKNTYIKLLEYKQYLRDITKDPNFPNIEIQPFQE